MSEVLTRKAPGVGVIIIGVDPGSTTDLAELLEDPRIMTEVLGGAK